MNQHLKIAAVAVIATAMTACTGVGSSVPGPSSNVQTSSVNHGTMAQAGINPSKVVIMQTRENAPLVQPNAHLTYRNGPVQVKASIYVIYWGFNVSGSDPSNEQTYMTSFLNGVGGSSWMNIDHQYYEIDGGIHHRIKNNVGQLKGTWVDTTAIPAAPTDAQIQAAAARGIAHFGFKRDASYVVATSHNHNSSGFGTQYCAYHGDFITAGHDASYTNMPYIPDAGTSCGKNFVNSGPAGNLDGVSIVEGHELAESQTDPQPASGWYDNSFGEIGDICAWQIPPAGNIVLSTGTFAVQGLWSNKVNKCTISG